MSLRELVCATTGKFSFSTATARESVQATVAKGIICQRVMELPAVASMLSTSARSRKPMTPGKSLPGKRESLGVGPETCNYNYPVASDQISANSSNSDTTCQKRSGLRS